MMGKTKAFCQAEHAGKIREVLTGIQRTPSSAAAPAAPPPSATQHQNRQLSIGIRRVISMGQFSNSHLTRGRRYGRARSPRHNVI